VLFGCEVNILNSNGDVDLSAKTMSGLDIVLAGLHDRTSYTGMSESDNTAAIINAIKKHSYINVISHPYRTEFPISVSEVIYASIEYRVLLEINASLLIKAMQNRSDGRAARVINRTAEMVNLLQSNKTGYVINSDAHHSSEVGITSLSLEVLSKELGVLPEYILNDRLDSLKLFIPAIGEKGGAL
jgi:putative hydrolase